MARVIMLYPKPYCPKCGATMKLRRPKSVKTFEPFWGCSTYPDCNGTRNIDADGKPEDDFDEPLEMTWKP